MKEYLKQLAYTLQQYNKSEKVENNLEKIKRYKASISKNQSTYREAIKAFGEYELTLKNSTLTISNFCISLAYLSIDLICKCHEEVNTNMKENTLKLDIRKERNFRNHK